MDQICQIACVLPTPLVIKTMKKFTKKALESLGQHLLVGVTVVAAVLFVFTYVKGQTVVPPGQTSVVPLLPLAALSTVPTPTVPELGTYVGNKAAARQPRH